ncbi:MAG: hypothetical protein L0H64_13790, partial [Pseudonocardia sp.]|nr:hypothetical protein [Pseudonocardia sp.]
QAHRMVILLLMVCTTLIGPPTPEAAATPMAHRDQVVCAEGYRPRTASGARGRLVGGPTRYCSKHS